MNLVYKLNTTDNSIDKLTNLYPIKENNYTDIAWFYCDWGTNTAKVKFVAQQFLDLTGVNPLPALKMRRETDTEIIDVIVPSADQEPGWSLYYFHIVTGISGLLKSSRATQYDIAFQELEIDLSDEDYLGEFATDESVETTISTAIKVVYPTAVNTNYVNVYETTDNDYKTWEFDGTDWNKQTTLYNEALLTNTQAYRETFKATVLTNEDYNVTDATEMALTLNTIYAELDDLNTRITAFETGASALMEIADYDTEGTATESVKYARRLLDTISASEPGELYWVSANKLHLRATNGWEFQTYGTTTTGRSYSWIKSNGDRLEFYTKDTSHGATHILMNDGKITITIQGGNILDIQGNTEITGTLDVSGAIKQNTVQVELQSNLVTAFSTPTDTQYPSAKLTQDYVDTQVASLVDAAPATLDTLNELAAALGDDANYAATTAAAIALRELLSNKVTSWTSPTTNVNYPSEKLVKDNLDLKLATSLLVTTWTGTPLDTNIPSEKLVKDYVDAQIASIDSFLEMADTPSAYTDKGHYSVKVNVGETALEFVVPDNNSITSVISGFVISINTDTTKFDVASGYFKFVELDGDHMDTEHNTYAGELAISALNITTTTRTYVGINSSGVIVTQNTPFTTLQNRTIARIGYANHPQTTIISVVTKPITANQFGLTINDLHPHPEVVNGNVYDAASTDMTIKVSGGDVQAIGINYETAPLNPNVHTLSAVDPITFVYVYRDGGVYYTLQMAQTDIIPNYYDDDSGTLSELALPANQNKATVQGLYRTEYYGETAVVYGQEIFDSMADAIEAVDAGDVTFDIPEVVTDNKVFRGYLILRAGGSNLSIEGDAIFKTVSVGAGGAGSTVGSLNDDKILNTSSDAPTLARGANQQLVNESLSEDVITLEHKVDMVYVSAGQYKATVDNFVLTDGRKLTLLFPNTLTDLTTAVQVSFDNGVTYKYLKYDDTDNDVTVKHTQNLKTEVYYNNTEWLMNGEPLINQSITFDSIVNSTNGAVKGIKGTPQMVGVKGNTFNAQQINGNFVDTSEWDTSALTSFTVSGNVGTILASAQNGYIRQQFECILGDGWYLQTWVRVTSATSNDVQVHYYLDASPYTASISQYHTGGGEWELLGGKGDITASGTQNLRIIDRRTSGWSNIEIKQVILINLENTRYASHTADQMNAIIPSYIEGINSITDFTLGTRGLNLFDGELEQGSISATTGIDEVGDRLRSIGYTPIKPSTEYIIANDNSYGISIFEYDIDMNFIQHTTASFTTTSNTYYVRFRTGLTQNDVTTLFMLEEGTTASAYVTYNAPSNDLVITTPLRSVGTTVHDYAYPLNDNWWLDKLVEVYTLTADDITGYTALTNVDLVSIDTLPNSINGGLGTTIVSLAMVSGYNEVTRTARDTVGNDNMFYTYDVAIVTFVVATGTYADLAAAKTALTGTVVYYVRDEVVTTEIPYSGSLIQESNTTLVQGNSNFATEYEIKFNLNVNAQVGVLVDKYLQVRDDVDTHDTRLDNIETKTDFITVTQAVDIDDIETNADASKVITDFITITQAVNLDDIETNSDASKVKTDFITVTQAVDLDTIESDTATNNDKVTYPSADSTKVGYITVAANVDLGKVNEWTELMATKVDIGSTDIGTTANITLSASMDNYDFLAFQLTDPVNNNGEVVIIPVQATIITALDIKNTKLSYQTFDLTRRSTTTFTADNAVQIALTVGGAGICAISSTGITSLDIEKVYGINL